MRNGRAMAAAMAAGIGFFGCAVAPAGEGPRITLESLLKEMTDVSAVARWPDPVYTCQQEGSWDRRTKTPEDAQGWFANGDNMESRGIPAQWETIQGRKECVLLDVAGPGAIVRFWSGGAKPKGKIRFYLDGAETPAIEAPMQDLFSGNGFVPRPLAIENAGAAINLYLPVPYAKRCKITYDEGRPPAPPPGRWYNVEYRKYADGTRVETFTLDQFNALKDTVETTCRQLLQPPAFAGGKEAVLEQTIEAGKEASVDLPAGPSAVRNLEVRLAGDAPEHAENVPRTTVLRMSFDGTETVWCPAGDFFGSGVGVNALNSWYRSVASDGTMACRWVMPYRKSARITVANLGSAKVKVLLKASVEKWTWDDRTLYFHGTWRQERQISTRPYKDWNYVTVSGKGMYLGDTLALFNPPGGWWGEGDEKIWVDGETFPSHIGTGSEDYYGYAWGNPALFQGPFCNQPRAGAGNKGHTTNTRTRSLDAIPFSKSLRTDIEIWHWKDTRVNYAAAAYWYAFGDATANVKPMPEEAVEPLPGDGGAGRTIRGAVECEAMQVLARSEGLDVSSQAGILDWSKGGHLWVKAAKKGDFVELLVAGNVSGPRKVTLHATRSHDYGILRFTVNGKAVDKEFDGYSGAASLAAPVELGTFEPRDGKIVLRAEVTGSNPKSTGLYFGLDAVALSASP